MLLRLFIAALLSPAGKGLTSWLSFVMFNCVFVTFLCGILGQMWYLVVSIPYLCKLSYLSCVAGTQIAHHEIYILHICSISLHFITVSF